MTLNNKSQIRPDHIKWIGREELAGKIRAAVVESFQELWPYYDPAIPGVDDLANHVINRLVGEKSNV